MSEKNTTTEVKKKKWFSEMLEKGGFIETSKPEINIPKSTISQSTFVSSSSSKEIVGNKPLFNLGTSALINSEKEKAAFEYFLKLLDQIDLPGPDFYEFYQALKENIQALNGSNTDEKVIYTMVFNTLKKMGLSFDLLISSNERYVQVLNEKYQSFLSENDKLLKAAIGSRQQKITDLTNDNNSKNQQIENLRKQIEENNSLINTVSEEIHKETANIEEAKSAFDSAFTKISTEFTTIGIKCKQYIQK